MDGERLVFNSMSEIMDGTGMGVIVLTDVDSTRALNIVCDAADKDLIQYHVQRGLNVRPTLLRVMLQMLRDYTDLSTYSIYIFGITGGKYGVAVTNTETGDYSHRIRIEDAVLLSLVSGMPMYIDAELMKRQCTPYKAEHGCLSVPMNSIETARLKEKLEEAVAKEDYLLASLIKEELDHRGDV